MRLWVYNITDLMGEGHFIRQTYHVMIDISSFLARFSSPPFVRGRGVGISHPPAPFDFVGQTPALTV